MSDLCVDCEYYLNGECRRYPPRWVPQHFFRPWKYPKVDELNWCGEFKNRGGG